MREIKFQFLYKGPQYSADNPGFNWHKKVYDIECFIGKPLSQLSDVHSSSELVAIRQWTGLKDKNGKDIFENDIVKCVGEDGEEFDEYHHHAAIKYCAEGDYPAFELKPNIDADSNGISYYLAVGSIEAIGNLYEHPHLLEAPNNDE